MAYKPQANGTAERMVQTLTREIQMYVSDENNKDRDEYAERLTYAINTAHVPVRGDTPFYLIYGWNFRSTLKATLPLGNTASRGRDSRRWRYGIQRQYQLARAFVNNRLKELIQDCADQHDQDRDVLGICSGSQVWLFLDRVKEGYA